MTKSKPKAAQDPLDQQIARIEEIAGYFQSEVFSLLEGVKLHAEAAELVEQVVSQLTAMELQVTERQKKIDQAIATLKG